MLQFFTNYLKKKKKKERKKDSGPDGFTEKFNQTLKNK